ncbi:MAG: hypothetical protein MUC49_12465 [Raineya sp.]|nr:hypothetical protein [Raineya sp.]
MKYIYIFLLFASCSRIPKSSTIEGNYEGFYTYKKNDSLKAGVRVRLYLYKNQTFLYKLENVPCAKPQCQGIWQTASKNTLLLKCNEADFSEMLSNGYISQREHTVVFLNRNQIELNKDTLVKVKEIKYENLKN